MFLDRIIRQSMTNKKTQTCRLWYDMDGLETIGLALFHTNSPKCHYWITAGRTTYAQKAQIDYVEETVINMLTTVYIRDRKRLSQEH